jgi:branched-chain amino acid transport system permease protein
MDIYILSLVTFGSINVILAIGLNTISGFCGQISLGHAAFYGVGAYTAALLSVNGVSFPVALIAGMAAAGAVGLVVGLASLRVREDFLAITTMGVSFLFLGFVRKQAWLGGEFGVAQIPSPLPPAGYAALSVACALGVIVVSVHTNRSWMGKVFGAVASNEGAAQTLGIDAARYKLWAFVLGTTSAGLAGGLYAHQVSLIVPDAFDFIQSITILAMVVIGGIGSTWGVVVGAILLTAMPHLFDFIYDYKLLVYGLLLLLVMRFSPEGLAALPRLVREWRRS